MIRSTPYPPPSTLRPTFGALRGSKSTGRRFPQNSLRVFVLAEEGESYAALLAAVIPAQVRPHRRRTRKRALKVAHHCRLHIAKILATKLLKGDTAALEAAEILIFDRIIDPAVPHALEPSWPPHSFHKSLTPI